MQKTKLVFVFLFCLFIALSYLNLISSQLSDFYEALEFRTTSGSPIYLSAFQLWVFDIISLLCDSTIIAIAVGLLGYYIKELPLYVALLFGLISRYIILLGFLLFKSSDGLPKGLFDELTKHLDMRLYILLSLQFVSLLYFSYLGFQYGRRIDYVDPKDKDLLYYHGIPKKIWVLLIVSYIPVATFLSRLTIINVYDITEKLSSMSFWKEAFSLSNIFNSDGVIGLSGLFGHVMFIFFAWAVVVVLFSYGLYAIKNKSAKFRWLIILCVFVLLPSMSVIIPILRSRTWFF